jgi:hypothetical protein
MMYLNPRGDAPRYTMDPDPQPRDAVWLARSNILSERVVTLRLLSSRYGTSAGNF